MKLLIKIITFLTIIPIHIFSQNETSKVQENDSTKAFKTDALFNISYKFDEFDFYRKLTKPIFNFEADSTNARLSLKTLVDMSNNFSFNNENPAPMYLHSILYEEYLDKSKFNPIRTALGFIQAGAVGYLAYRHIKKWGFLK